MEILAFTLLLIFILYLIDKHNRWMALLKIILVLIALGLLGWGGLFGYYKYQDYRENQALQQRERQEEAQAAAVKQKVAACVAKMKAASRKWNSTDSGDIFDRVSDEESATKICTNNPDAQPINLDALPPNTVVSDSGEIVHIIPKKTAPRGPVARHVVAKQDVGLTTTEFGTLVCCHVKQSEILTLVSESAPSIQVRTAEGKVGWAFGSYFEMEK